MAYKKISLIRQALVVQTLDNAIHRINLYPVDSVIDFHNTYPLDSDLSGGQHHPMFEQLGPGDWEDERSYRIATLQNASL